MFIMNKYKSKILNDNYKIEKDKIIFDSGIEYNKNEINIIKNCSENTLRAIHKIKNYFQGEVIK